MSFYRNPRQRYPDRAAEKREADRKAEAEAKKRTEMNATNFPSLSETSAPAAVAGNKYAQFAEKWAVDASTEQRMEAYKKSQEERKRRETENMFVFRQRRLESRFENYEEEYDEDVSAPSYRPAELDETGWTQVGRKARKEKQDLTVEQLDERAREMDEGMGQDGDFNEHLFESNRHDHHRV
jgi:hypothetical protein